MSDDIKDESLSAFARRLSNEGALIHCGSWQQITGTLQMCADEIDTQAARIAELESERGTAGYARKIESLIAERDQLLAEVERLRGERMVFVELVRDLLQVVDTVQPHSDEMNEIEMLHALTTRARSAIDGVLRAIEAAKEAK